LEPTPLLSRGALPHAAGVGEHALGEREDALHVQVLDDRPTQPILSHREVTLETVVLPAVAGRI